MLCAAPCAGDAGLLPTKPGPRGLIGLKGASGSSSIPAIAGDLGSPSSGRRGDVKSKACQIKHPRAGMYVVLRL